MAAVAFELTDMEETVGFTERDRETLTVLQVEMKHLVEGQRDVLVRIGKLEERAVSTGDLEDIYRSVDELREEKADKKDLSDSMVKDHEQRIRSIERRMWMYMGGVAVIVVLTEFVSRLLK